MLSVLSNTRGGTEYPGVLYFVNALGTVEFDTGHTQFSHPKCSFVCGEEARGKDSTRDLFFFSPTVQPSSKGRPEAHSVPVLEEHISLLREKTLVLSLSARLHFFGASEQAANSLFLPK